MAALSLDMLGGDTSPEGSLLAQAIRGQRPQCQGDHPAWFGDYPDYAQQDHFRRHVRRGEWTLQPETAINRNPQAISAYNQQKPANPSPAAIFWPRRSIGITTGAAPSVPRSGDQRSKGAGGVTEGASELDGVSIRIPTIDEEQQRLLQSKPPTGARA